MFPVTGFTVRPGGNPAAEYIRTSPSVSFATSCSATVAVAALVRSPGLTSDGGRFVLITVHWNDFVSDWPAAVAVTEALYVPALVKSGVPEITPVDGLVVSPGGNPAALYTIGSPSGSLADSCSEIDVPSACV